MTDHAPAPLAAVIAGGDGTLYEVDQDVLDIVKQLHEIDPTLRVRWNDNEVEPYYVVYCRPNDREEYLVTTTRELDQRLVERIREISSAGYDFVAERDLMRKVADAERAYAAREKLLEAGERAHFSVQHHLGAKPRIFLPRGIEDTE